VDHVLSLQLSTYLSLTGSKQMTTGQESDVATTTFLSSTLQRIEVMLAALGVCCFVICVKYTNCCTFASFCDIIYRGVGGGGGGHERLSRTRRM